MKSILGKIRRAVIDYHMIRPEETVCVGVSGGKDSMLLLKAMVLYSKFSPTPFHVHAISLDLGFKNTDYESMRDFCSKLGVPLTIKKTKIGAIVFEHRQEKNPCALCSNLKRGALHNLALELGSHTVALGHHADDLLETYLLSLLFEGRMHTFQPVTFLDRKQVTVIRPMIYIREKEIIYETNKQHIPVLKSNCPADGNTKRAEMKQLVKDLQAKIPDCDERMIHAVRTMVDQQHRNNHLLNNI